MTLSTQPFPVQAGHTEILFLSFRDRQNDDAFTELYERKVPEIMRAVRNSLGPFLSARVDVEDIVQETFIEAFRFRDQFCVNGERSFTRWVSRIARHRILAHFKRFSSLRRTPPRDELSIEGQRDAEGENEAFHVASEELTPFESLASSEVFRIFDQCVGLLTEEEEQVVRLVLIEGYAHAEVGERLGISTGAARMRFHRACIKLRGLIEQQAPAVEIPA